jgi:transposase-like protein
MATEKTQNYSVEVTAQLVEAFKAGATVEALAKQFGKSTRSIVAKLSREGVYQAKAKAKGNTEARVTKAELVAKIAEGLGVEQEVLDSLEKATAQALTLVAEAVTK